MFGKDKDISDYITDYQLAREVAQNTLRLPQSLSKSYNIDQSIKELENYNNQHLPTWRKSTWLKGALGIILMKIMNSFSMEENYDTMKNTVSQWRR